MIDVIIIGLATARLVRLFMIDEGPFGLFKKIRWAAGIRILESSQGIPIRIVQESFWAKLLDCHWCLGIWAAIFAAVLYHFCPILPSILAAAEVAGLIGKFLESNYDVV